MILTTANRAAVANWVLEQCQSKGRFFDDFKTIAALVGDRIIGAVVFDSFTEHDCELHIALTDKRSVTRANIRQIFEYPFKQLGLARVTVQVNESNARSLEFVQRLGFTLEGVKKHGNGKEDKFMFGMTKRNCRWLDVKP